MSTQNVEAGVEPVRLVVWDLDDTFWRGTVTEGGIQEYVQEHHDIIIELARRGILSSVCSKNDPDTVLSILKDKGILDYIVFPSISWEPKGIRLLSLIETVALRAPTVMFIDDNPNNRAEALAIVPGLQVESELFIKNILTDVRFKGKSDHELSRLKQYKLLETRHRDEKQSTGGNEEFLRKCDVRVRIEYDVVSNIDRAVELINRTNQLNFTKKRLSENIERARTELFNDIKHHDRQAGLIHVQDNYGDYGFVGFFETESKRKVLVPGKAQSSLKHYCFSCRTLGMLVEKWVYDYLRQPELEVVGEVLTDVSVEKNVDWIRLVTTFDKSAQLVEKIAPQIVVWGGCEGNAIGVYLQAYASETKVYGNFASSGMFTRINSALQVLAITRRDPQTFTEEAHALGLPIDLCATNIFDAPVGTLFAINGSRDAGEAHYFKHKKHGWIIHIEPRANIGADMLTSSDEEILLGIEKKAHLYQFTDEQKAEILRICRHVRENYSLYRPNVEVRIEAMRQVINSVPAGSKLVIMVNHYRQRVGYEVKELPEFFEYLDAMHKLKLEYDFVGVAAYSDVVRSDDEIQSADHFERSVYHRFSQVVVETAGRLTPRAAERQIMAG